jgi:hypothetical protein
MDTDLIREIREDDILRKRLAKWMARFCFRNTKLEELHNRISDEDMKALLIDCVNRCYAFLVIFSDPETGSSLVDMLKQEDMLPQWDEPEMPRDLIEAAKKVPDIREHLKRGTAS